MKNAMKGLLEELMFNCLGYEYVISVDKWENHSSINVWLLTEDNEIGEALASYSFYPNPEWRSQEKLLDNLTWNGGSCIDKSLLIDLLMRVASLGDTNRAFETVTWWPDRQDYLTHDYR